MGVAATLPELSGWTLILAFLLLFNWGIVFRNELPLLKAQKSKMSMRCWKWWLIKLFLHDTVKTFAYGKPAPSSTRIKKSSELFVKGNLQSKKSLAQMIKREKCKKMSHHRPQCVKWFSRYPISKSGIWARWTSPFCRFLATFSIKYDVTDALLRDIEKMKVRYLRSLLFDLFEILQAVWNEHKKFAWFQISLLWQIKRE